VYYALKGGAQDYIIVSGETVEELKEELSKEMKKRDAIPLMTEKIKD
jgi:hypothetical protein